MKRCHWMWEIISTWFYVGRVSHAPGTVGSFITLPLIYLLNFYLGINSVLVFILIFTIVGIIASDKYAECIGKKDPGMIIVDEVVGQSIALIFAGLSLPLYLCGFVFFRFFDILKPWPISWADKKVSGGLGIMLDDVFAGLISMVLVLLLKNFVF